MVAQEDAPLAVGRNLRRLAQDVGEREAVFLGQRHVHARHQREVKGHVAFIAVAEVGLHILRPHIGLSQQHAARKSPVQFGADFLENDVRFGEVFVARAFALYQVGNGVQPQAIDAELQPELHDLEHFLEHQRVVEIEVGLV
jgi:hypothetical protein